MTPAEVAKAEAYAQQQREALAQAAGTARTFSEAYRIARPLAAAGDRAAAARLLSGLLWHVEASNGGFIGLTDLRLQAKCAADPRLSYADAVAAMWVPPKWPETVERRAAA